MNALETRIARRWSEVLGLERIGTDELFFEIGGTSLQAVQFVGWLSSELGERVRVAEFFAAPSIRALAQALRAQHGEAVSRWIGGDDTPPTEAARTDAGIAAAPQPSFEPIAVVGLACRFPGAANVEQFWLNLLNGVESIRPVSAEQLTALNVPAAMAARADFVKASGWIDDADCFDAAFFGYTPREAELMDPQQRILLECAWHALENAGLRPEQDTRRIGVFSSVGPNNYLMTNLASHAPLREPSLGPVLIGNDKDYSATRIAFKLDLRGPAISVQTACSSGGVALHLAMQSLHLGECDAALVAASSLPWGLRGGYLRVEGGPLSHDGHIRPFDAEASGMVLTGGAACVVLRRLDRARAAGERIYSVIRGSALTNDGSEKAAYTAPSVRGQRDTVLRALAAAGVTADSIGYVEAHGTGTPIGDPIELSALTEAFRTQTRKVGYCALGALKANIGHLDACSALASVIKASLSLHTGRLPPTINFSRPNPECQFQDSPFVVPTREQAFPAVDGVRRAGVSSFGFGGTNFHAVLEQAPPVQGVAPAAPRGWRILRWSAKTPEARRAQGEQLGQFLARTPDADLDAIADSLSRGRARLDQRGICVATDLADAVRRLGQAESRIEGSLLPAPRSVVFMFPGQGSQHPGMGREVYETEAVYRETIDYCASRLTPVLGTDLRELMFPSSDAEAAGKRLRDTFWAQPAIFSVSYALAQMWIQRGLEPDTMIGHSVGEYVAATLAGVFTLDDALTVLAERARLMQASAPGSMLAVRLPEDKLRAWLLPGISLAAINAPQLCVVSGPRGPLEGLEARLGSEGVGSAWLHTSHAFHSAMMDPVLEPFAKAVAAVPRQAPKRPFHSSVTGKPITDAEAQDPNYWARQLRDPVRFAPGLADLLTQPGRVFLEVGPSQNLTLSARQNMSPRHSATAIASLPHAGADGSSETQCLAEALGRLWIAGVELAGEPAPSPLRRPPLGMPGYPFARSRFWVEPAAAASESAPATTAAAASGAATPAATAAPLDRATQVRQALMRILYDVTGLEPLPEELDRSFLELGLDSLLLTQVAGRVSHEFSTPVGLRRLLEDYPSVNALCAHLEERALSVPGMTAAAAAPPRAADGGDAPEPPQAKPFGAAARINLSTSETLSETSRRGLDDLVRRYNARTGRSKAYAQAHRKHLADPRTVSGFRPLFKDLVYPIVTDRSDGAYLWDLDGNRYIDITNGFGCIFFGHRPRFVVEALRAQLELGFEIGPQSSLAGHCAAAVSRLVGFPRVAFCNTGSEAVLAATRVARTITGRNLIVMFTGDYHGIFDEVIVRGSKSGRSLPAAPGIPPEAVANTLILEYGSEKSLEVLRQRGSEIAAVLVEPVQSRRPNLQPREFLHAVRKITQETGTAFIMDEVITGFRVAMGGAQEHFGVRADLGCYGKVIGGGMSIGVVAGIERFMDALDGGFWSFGDDSAPEVGVTYFAGTFVRHPITLAAVQAVCKHLEANPTLASQVNAKTQQLVDILNTDLRQAGAPMQIANFSSLFKPEWTVEQHYGELFYVFLREFGIHAWDGRPCFLTTAHSDADIEHIVEGFRYAVAQMQQGQFFELGEKAPKAAPVMWRSPYAPPMPGARIGRDPDGNPGWFVPDPAHEESFLRVVERFET